MTAKPLIVLGMHRSGTSLLVQMLRDLGVFTGWSSDHNGEARLFLALNEWMLSQAGCRWDAPLLIPESLEARLAGVAERQLQGFGRFTYLPPRQWWHRGGIPGLQQTAWGWKDPRNTFTLGVWLRLFPDARIVHLHRHPLDVAASLRQRSLTPPRGRVAATRRWISEKTLLRIPVYTSSTLGMDLQQGVRLWERYVEQSLAWCDQLDDQTLSLSFEQLVAEPAAQIDLLTDFLDLDPNDHSKELACSRIHHGRRLAFRCNQELEAAAAQLAEHPLVLRLGYATH